MKVETAYGGWHKAVMNEVGVAGLASSMRSTGMDKRGGEDFLFERLRSGFAAPSKGRRLGMGSFAPGFNEDMDSLKLHGIGVFNLI
jgi:hypothetical protein